MFEFTNIKQAQLLFSHVIGFVKMLLYELFVKKNHLGYTHWT